VDRGKAGSKHHVLVDAHGIPPAATVTGGNRNDVTQLLPLIQAVPPIRGKRGRPRRPPDVIYADRGYDHDKYRRQVRDLGKRNRWVVEAPSPFRDVPVAEACWSDPAASLSAGLEAWSCPRPSSGN
jgi:hypothetical protein